MFIIDWYMNFAHSFIHGVMSHHTRQDGTKSPSVYLVLSCVFSVFGLAGTIFWGAERDGFWGALRRAPLAGAVWVWPWVFLGIVVALMLAGPVLFVYSYVKLLPSREERRERAARKVAELRMQKSDLNLT